MQAVPPAKAWPDTAPEVAASSLGHGEVHVWWIDLAHPVRPPDELARWLDVPESERAARFRFELHRRRHVAAHGQMRLLLGAYLGRAPAALRFASEERGKPHLARAGGASAGELVFNLSHSDDQALLAIARDGVLGADIEVHRPLPDLESLARCHFAPAELRELWSLPPARHLDGFFAAWTRKEAYVKALGAGLAVPLESFEVTLHPDEPASLRSIDSSEELARTWTLWAARPTPDSWAAVAVHTPAATVRTFSLRGFALP